MRLRHIIIRVAVAGSGLKHISTSFVEVHLLLTLPLVLLLFLQAKAPVANLELAEKHAIEVPTTFIVHPYLSSVPLINILERLFGINRRFLVQKI